MKYGAGLTVPVAGDVVAPLRDEWAAFDVDGSPLSTIEEPEASPALRATARSDRLIGVVVAACAALVCFGFAGRMWTSDTPASGILVGATASSVPLDGDSPVLSFALDEPADGAVAAGGRIHVHGTAHEPIDRIHVAIDLGSAVLGWANLDVAAGGGVDGDVRLFEPPFDVPAAVVVSGRTRAGEAFEFGRTIKIRAGAPVTVWQRQIESSWDGKADRDLIVDGSARSSIGEVSIDVETSAGQRFAHATVANAQDDYRPGSVGGALVGRGSFRARIVLPEPVPPEGWVVRISWVDKADGAHGSINHVVSAVDRGGPT
jgi:hypothetical protein